MEMNSRRFMALRASHADVHAVAPIIRGAERDVNLSARPDVAEIIPTALPMPHNMSKRAARCAAAALISVSFFLSANEASIAREGNIPPIRADIADVAVGNEILPVTGQAIAAYLQHSYPLESHQVAAILANIKAESTFDPTARDGNFFGLCQWSLVRTNALKAFAAAQDRDYQGLFTQVDFIMHEMGIAKTDIPRDESLEGFGIEAASGTAMLAAKTLAEANSAMRDYERYANGGRTEAYRLRLAENILPVVEQQEESLKMLPTRLYNMWASLGGISRNLGGMMFD